MAEPTERDNIEYLYTLRETAEFFSVPTSTVRRWVRDGLIKTYRIPKPGMRNKVKPWEALTNLYFTKSCILIFQKNRLKL